MNTPTSLPPRRGKPVLCFDILKSAANHSVPIPRLFCALCAVVFCFIPVQAAPGASGSSGAQPAPEPGSSAAGKSLEDKLPSGLLARWTGDGNAKDSTGEFDGKVSGGLSYVPGPAGRAFQFNGGDAEVNFGNSIGNFGTRDFTVAYWMKTDSRNPHEAILAKRTTCDGALSFLEIEIGGAGGNPPTGILCLSFEVGDYKPVYSLISSHPMNDGRWHHIAWVRQSTSSGNSTGLIYVDGALDNSRNYPETVDIANQSPLLLGQNVCQCCDGCRPYSGAAADLQLFSHALSAEEILTIYQAGKSGK